MLLDLIRAYGDYCKMAGESAGTIEDYLLGWLTEEEVRVVLTDIQRLSLGRGSEALLKVLMS